MCNLINTCIHNRGRGGRERKREYKRTRHGNGDENGEGGGREESSGVHRTMIEE